MAGTVEVGMKSGTIPPFAPHVLYNPDSVPDGFVGSVRVTSNGKLVGEVSEEHKYGRDPRLIYNMPLEGSTNVYLPLWYDNYTDGGDWASGVNVYNTGSGNNQVTITWYRLDGTTEQHWRDTRSWASALLIPSITHRFFPATLSAQRGFTPTATSQSSPRPTSTIGPRPPTKIPPCLLQAATAKGYSS